MYEDCPGVRQKLSSEGVYPDRTLVVIAIIAILAALLLPALARAKAAEHSVKCNSNLRQLGLGLGTYVSDFGKYPFYWWAVTGTPKARYWFNSLEPYTAYRWTNDLHVKKCVCADQSPEGRFRSVTYDNVTGNLR